MFGSRVLDVALGLITVYLTLALAVTAANEMLSHWRRWRARHLETGLVQMLDGRPGPARPDHWFFQLPLVQSWRDADGHLPAFIDKADFSAALLLALAPDFAARPLAELQARLAALPLAPATRALLENFCQLANGDLLNFRAQIERWFEHAMLQTRLRYQRHLARWSLVLATALALGANADTISLARALYVQGPARDAVLEQQTQQMLSSPSTRTLPQASEFAVRTLALTPGLPLGWQASQLPSGFDWLSKALGILLTVLATSLGAPFWFDLLARLRPRPAS